MAAGSRAITVRLANRLNRVLRREQNGRRPSLNDELAAGNLRCFRCKRVVTMDNLRAYGNLDDELVVTCDSLLCIWELSNRAARHREALHPRVDTGPPRRRPWCWVGVHRWRLYGANERCADCHKGRVTVTFSSLDK